MRSFDSFGAGGSWFYSFIPYLEGCNHKPSRFASWADWDKLRNGQQIYLSGQAGLSRNPVHSDAALEKLKRAYKSWNPQYYVVTQGGGTSHHSTCNIFVGECLTLCGHGRQAVSGGKYLSAKSYWMNYNHVVRSVARNKASVKRGMIMSYNFGNDIFHLEVITSGAQRGTKPIMLGLMDKDIDTFKSRGGGRASGENGVEKLGGSDARDLADENLKLYQVR
jgi:hypothetical protein